MGRERERGGVGREGGREGGRERERGREYLVSFQNAKKPSEELTLNLLMAAFSTATQLSHSSARKQEERAAT